MEIENHNITKSIDQLNSNLKDLFPEELLALKNKPLLYEFLGTYLVYDKSKFKIAKEINYEIPQIILPNNKIDMIINWWNETIRFEKTIPRAFNEGYIKLDFNIYNKKVSLDRTLIRKMAELQNLSVYYLKDKFSRFLNTNLEIYLYFKFLNENKIHFRVMQKILNSTQMVETWSGTIKFGESEDEPKIDQIEPLLILSILLKDYNTKECLQKIYAHMGRYYIAILSTILWYITTSNSTKYIYKETKYRNNHIDKNIINVKDEKIITSTIYDLRKVKYVNIETLNRRKLGWTYSHSFEVHGHYRHYKNGKTIFINPYIKGKDKTFKSQKIILNPKENKDG